MILTTYRTTLAVEAVIPSIQQLCDHIWNTVSSLGLPVTEGALTFRSMFNGGPSR